MGTTLFLILSTTFILMSTSARSRRWCPKYCMCWRQKMTCDGRKFPLELRTIPRAPTNITTVIIRDINLGQLTKNLTSNLTHCNMTAFSLIETNITRMTDDAFVDLKYLETFIWEQSYISFSVLDHCLRGMNKNLQDLRIKATDTHSDTMNATIFENLLQVTHLSVNLGRLKVFDATALSHLLYLDEIDLSSNILMHLVMGAVIPNVTHLNLEVNNFVDIPQICGDDSKAIMPRLKNLNIGRNSIKTLNVEPLTCLHNFLKLTLSENRIEELQYNAFAGLSTLFSLHMYRLPLKKIYDLAFNSSSLYKLEFKEIPILSPKRFNPSTIFEHTPSLGILDMTSTKMDIKINRLRELLLDLKNIEKLVLQRTNIQVLPSGVFSKLPKLNTLILSGNYFSSWKSDVFENVTSIRKISFDGCNINTIHEDSFPLKFRLSVKEINLADNPFTCTCELLWFRNWMKEVMANKSIKFSNYPQYYECRAPNVDRLKLADFNPTVKSCTVSQLYTIILTIVLCFCLMSIVVGLVAYRYRWHLLYWISLLRRRRRKREQELVLGDKYDAFVSYSNNDNDWIYDELLNYVEGELELRLCEHSRDFDIGKLIVDNVFDAIDSSVKTILVISNDYMQSDWCQFELQMALNSFYKHETDLVVVLLEPIKTCHVTNTLRALMTSTTYIEWSDDLEAQNLFRERIKTSLQN